MSSIKFRSKEDNNLVGEEVEDDEFMVQEELFTNDQYK